MATPLGDRRLGFKQFGARQLKEESGWSITPQWFTFTPDFENMQDPNPNLNPNLNPIPNRNRNRNRNRNP